MGSSNDAHDMVDSIPATKMSTRIKSIVCYFLISIVCSLQHFLVELEFVQCLANPTYIHYLAQDRYFEDENFINYLKYLQYWQRPEFLKYIMYSHCLFFLELLQNINFRNAIAHPESKELAPRQQFYFWKYYRNNRLKYIFPRFLPEPTPAPPALTTAPPPLNPAFLPIPAPSLARSPMQYAFQPASGVPRMT